MACRENEAVAVQPTRLGGVEGHRCAEKGGSDVSGSEWQAEVAGFAFGDGVHGQTAGIAGGKFKRGGVEGHIGWCLRDRKTSQGSDGKPWCFLEPPDQAGQVLKYFSR